MDAMAIAAMSMQDDIRRLNTISQNLANVLTPGYKKQIAVVHSFAQQVEAASAQQSGRQNVSAPTSISTLIDPSSGTLRYTGNLQDVAIEGSGFFELSGKNGLSYTRQGTLRADINGKLVGSQGLPVLGVGGEIVVTSAPITVDANGDVRQGDHIAGRLKIVHFSNPEVLEPIGNGMYQQGGARVADGEKRSTVRAGFQENSNVSSPQEMVRLTETVRHFESLQKFMQGYDESLEKAIRKLGEF